MKNRLLLFCVMLISPYASAQNNYTLTGQVPPSLNGQIIYLRIIDSRSGNSPNKIDSTLIHNAHFFFKGTIQEPCEIANMYMLSKKGATPGNLNFVLEAKNNELIASPVSRKDRFYKNSLSKTIILNSQANYISRKLDSIETVFFLKTKKTADDASGISTIKQQLKIIAQYPDQFFCLLKLSQIARTGYILHGQQGLIVDAFNKFDPLIRSSTFGKEFISTTRERLDAYNSSKVGMRVRNFCVLTDKGQNFCNKTLLGSPYVIAFSATWCVPCQEYQKKLLTYYNSYKTKGLKVIYFNLDDDVKKWEKHIKENNLQWINVSERTKVTESRIAKQFNANWLPLYIIVNKKGVIIYNGDEMKDDNYDLLEKYIKMAL